MNPAETAVAEDAHDFIGLNGLTQLIDNCIGRREVECLFALGLQGADEFFGIKAFLRRKQFQSSDLGDGGAVGEGKGFGEFVLEDATAGGV